jgi:hypothetical protein
MGGKSKILDPKQLESIYVESRRFAQKAETGIQTIEGELAKLNDPSFQSGLSGGQGEAAKAAISNVTNAIAALKETLSKTSQFIDQKLAGAAQLAKDKQGFGDIGSKANATAQNMNLRK